MVMLHLLTRGVPQLVNYVNDGDDTERRDVEVFSSGEVMQ